MSEARPRLLRAWPLFGLVALAVVFSLMLFFSRKAPVIVSVEPSMAAPGETVVVSGDYFGRTSREGSLSISGEIPPPSLIRSWSDQKIVFDVPEDAASGLLTVSNTQGTSQGVLYTNTESIPTVLQNAAAPGKPLIVSVLPSRPVSGQTVTLAGRGFGDGAGGFVRVVTGGPLLSIASQDCASWSDDAVSFVLPGGVGPDSTARVVTPRGESAPYGLQASSPVVYGASASVTVEFRAQVDSTRPVTVWGPVPQDVDTTWAASGPVQASWGGGSHELKYRLTLTSWSKTASVPGGTAPPAPTVDTSLFDDWKSASAALKTLTAAWGLDAPDPWLKVQRLQIGLAGFRRQAAVQEKPGLRSAPAALLTSKSLDSFETASLAAYLGTQAGLTMRLVSGLVLDGSGTPSPRTWTEVWLPGGWFPWDPVDGTPGSLDDRHFAFAVGLRQPERLLPQSSTWGAPAPATLGDVTGEVALPRFPSDPEPVVRWEVTRIDK